MMDANVSQLASFSVAHKLYQERLKSSDGGGGDDMLETRVAKLESDVEYIKRDVSDLKTDVRGLSNDVSAIKVDVAKSLQTIADINGRMALKSDITTSANKLLMWFAG
ncbi:hypothetical protein [Symbiopectobacterium sp. RP]|uniref:hypothetical protein n=1 Tax=Symbiopectobacterium sp. RP TaxID=3248553 RepID=UPI003D29B5A9